MELVPMTRAELTDSLNANRDGLKKDLFMVTSIRGTKNNSLQVEVCQNRRLAGRKRTALGALNRSDSRFGNATTLLFDWMHVTPENFREVFPTIKITEKQLQEIADLWSTDAKTGRDATVYAILENVKTMVVDGEELTPVIVVTEVTESGLSGAFFKGEDADEKARDVIENGNAAMKAGSEADAEFLVHPETGEKVYRFVQTLFAEDNPEDKIIQGKITESHFKKVSQKRAKQEMTPQDFKKSILNQPDGV